VPVLSWQAWEYEPVIGVRGHAASKGVRGFAAELLVLLHRFNGLFSMTTWVSRHRRGRPFWIFLEQEMMRWQWHQLDYMQIICTSLQTDNHANTVPLSFFTAGCPSCHPTNSVKALNATEAGLYLTNI